MELTRIVRAVELTGPDGGTTLDPPRIAQLRAELDAAEADPACRILLLTAAPGTFCTGMNLVRAGRGEATDDTGDVFFDLLVRLTRAPLMVVAAVDGTAAGGGVGLAAASDLVYATGRASFALPEALWGLLPCCVLPFLQRRVGFQRAYAMALTTQPVDAPTAAGWGLVDEVTEDPAVLVRRLAFRAARLDRSTVGDLKRYAHGLHTITTDTRDRAVAELGRLMALPAVRQRLAAYATHGRYPWET